MRMEEEQLNKALLGQGLAPHNTSPGWEAKGKWAVARIFLNQHRREVEVLQE